MVYDGNRTPYRPDQTLTGFAGHDYDAAISLGMPYEPEDSQYGEYWSKSLEGWFTAMGIDATFVTVVLILAILAAVPAGVIVAVYAAKRLSPVTFSPIVPWVLVAVVILMIVAALLFLIPVRTTSESYSEPAPVTGDFEAALLPRSPDMAENESCWYAEPAVDSRSLVNIPQWRYTQGVEWCGDGSRIVGTPLLMRSLDSLDPFWAFERYHHVSEGEWGPERYIVFSHAKFRFCVVLQALCLDDDDPSLDMTVFGNGTFNVEYHDDWTAGDETIQVVRTSLWEALWMALAGVLAVSPLAIGLIVGGFIAMRSKLQSFHAVGTGMLAGGTTLAAVFVALALLLG